MRRAQRLLRLVQILRARRTATAAELADEVGVSTRTIYRSVRDLEDAGVPIEGEAGVGYRLSHRVDLPSMTFTPEELEALVLGVRMVRTWGDPDLADAARLALDRIQGALPGPLARAIDKTVLFSNPVPWKESTPVALKTLREAIARQRVVALHYVDRHDAETTRTIRPLGLYFWGTVWTVAAWCELRAGFRNFRADRVVRAELLDRRFQTDENTDLEAFVVEMRASPPGPTGR